MIPMNDALGLLALGVLFGLAFGLWFGWHFGFLAGESASQHDIADELTFHLADYEKVADEMEQSPAYKMFTKEPQ